MVLAAAVVTAGPAGLVGLLIGRWGSDILGRRLTVAVGLVLIAVTGMVTYSGSPGAAFAGYVAAVTGGSVFVPAIGGSDRRTVPHPGP